MRLREHSRCRYSAHHETSISGSPLQPGRRIFCFEYLVSNVLGTCRWGVA